MTEADGQADNTDATPGFSHGLSCSAKWPDKVWAEDEDDWLINTGCEVVHQELHFASMWTDLVRVRLISITVLVFTRRAGGELMISGLADIEAGRFFVELYTTTDIPDLSQYTLVTERSVVLPAVALGAGQYYIAANKPESDMEEFFGQPIPNFLHDGDVKLGGGNDPVFLEVNSNIVDAFGEAGESYSYKHGYVTRVAGVEAPKAVYDAADWTPLADALKKCWIDDDPPGNANCPTPYGVTSFIREFSQFWS